MKIVIAFAGAMAVILLVLTTINMSSVRTLSGRVRLLSSRQKKIRAGVDRLAAGDLTSQVELLKEKSARLERELRALIDRPAGLSEAEVEQLVQREVEHRARAIARREVAHLRGEMDRELRQRLAELKRSGPRAAPQDEGRVAAAGAGDKEEPMNEAEARRAMERGGRALVETMTRRLAEQAGLTDEQTKKMNDLWAGAMRERMKIWTEVREGEISRDDARQMWGDLRQRQQEQQQQFLDGLTDEQRGKVEELTRGWRGRWGGRGNRGDRGNRGEHGGRGDRGNDNAGEGQEENF